MQIQTWKEAQDFEKHWHGNCINSYYEETKQIMYAKRMGLIAVPEYGRFPCYDLKGKSVLDIGGGAYSLLLKSFNKGLTMVADPIEYPEWVARRYEAADIDFIQVKGEDIDKLISYTFDEVWMYNVLQHVENPEKVIQNARKLGKIIRYFDWVDHGITIGHIHDLKEKKLNKWFSGEGKVEEIIYANQFMGKAYFGIFASNYEEMQELLLPKKQI